MPIGSCSVRHEKQLERGLRKTLNPKLLCSLFTYIMIYYNRFIVILQSDMKKQLERGWRKTLNPKLLCSLFTYIMICYNMFIVILLPIDCPAFFISRRNTRISRISSYQLEMFQRKEKVIFNHQNKSFFFNILCFILSYKINGSWSSVLHQVMADAPGK